MLALFVALGGTALAVHAKAKPVVVCGNGSVKAIAAVNLDSFAGSFPISYSNDPSLFAARWSCNGKAAEIRQVSNGVYDIRFPNITPRVANVTVMSGQNTGSASWSPTGDGAFRVYTIDGDGAMHSHGFAISVY